MLSYFVQTTNDCTGEIYNEGGLMQQIVKVSDLAVLRQTEYMM